MEPVDEEVLEYLSWTEVKVAIHPKEPECFNDKPHTWKSPYEIVGGIEENPGVWGSGGGVRTHECCMQCGCERVTNTWTQDPNDGSEGHVSITYRKNEYLEQVHNLMLSKRGEEIKAVLSDYGPVSTRPGELIVALESLGDEADEDDLLDALREKLPGWASADWTGSSGTDKYGDTTWDVQVVWNVE